MKKALPVLLCLCMLISVFPVYAASAEDFSDIKSSDWFYDAVSYAVDNSLFSGTSTATFSPSAPMTRGMFVTVLAKYSGFSGYAAGSADITEAINMRSGPGTDYSISAVLHGGDKAIVYGVSAGWYKVSANGVSGYIRSDLIKAACGPFSDVSVSGYYAPGVCWAYESGLVSGTSASTFSPGKAVKREEICAILNKFAEKQHLTLSGGNSRTTFSDEGSISPSFIEAVHAMQGAGVVSGRANGAFAPKAPASRAEVATMLRQFILSTGKSPAPDYSYSGTVPESAPVSDAYFDDACFIGHSLVVGMKTYFNLLNSDYFAVNGISASRLLTYGDFELPDGSAGTISDALSAKTYGKIYIMLGVNELSGADSDRRAFYSSMSSFISLVKQKQPRANLYVISLTPVTKAESDSGAAYNFANIDAYNKILQQLAREKSAGYLDFFTLFADGNGYMPPEGAASDGIHPVQSQYAVMKNYIKAHT